MPSVTHSPPRIAFLLPSLRGGGAERSVVRLLRGMAGRGVSLDLVLAQAEGPYLAEVPAEVRVVDLGCRRMRSAVRPLARYLRRARPYALVANVNHTNLAAVSAQLLARTRTRLVLVEHSTLSSRRREGTLPWHVAPLMRLLYRRSDCVVAVSEGVARDLELQLGLAPGSVRVIYNPVVTPELHQAARQPLDDAWFAAGQPPVLVSLGRLIASKDHATLLRAFRLLRNGVPARLLILGDGPMQDELERLAVSLDLGGDVRFGGFTANPYAYLRGAACLVLSSRFEGLPTVLIEALACGCPVVSTDCPSGPAEILARGEFGPLVPVGDAQAMAVAMHLMLLAPPDPASLRRRGDQYAVHRAVAQYRNLLGFAVRRHPPVSIEAGCDAQRDGMSSKSRRL